MADTEVDPSSLVRWPSASVALVLRRMAAVLAGAWLTVDGYGVVTAPSGTFRLPVLAVAGIAGGLAASVLVGLWSRIDARVLVVGAAFACAADVLLSASAPSSENAFVVYWLPGLVAVCAGFLLAERSAVVIITLTAVLSSWLMLTRTIGVGPADFAMTSTLASLTFTACDGAAALLLARALRRAAAAADADMTLAENERAAVELAARQRAEDAELAASLHDSVFNTLRAVADNGDILDATEVRRASAQAAQVADSILVPEPVTAPDASTLAAAITSGSPRPPYPVVTLDGASADELVAIMGRVPSSVGTALIGGIHEALVNVVKHSGRRQAQVQVAGRGPVDIVVSDDGVGFDGQLVEGRGLALSVVNRCAAAGIDVQVDSAPGAGTRVRFCYDESVSGSLDGQAALDREQILRAVRLPFAKHLSYCLLVMCSCLTLIAAADAWSPGSVVALGVLAAVAVTGARLADAQGWLSRNVVVGILALLPLIVVLPGYGIAGCDRLGPAWWGTDGALVPFTLLLFLTRGWWPLVGGLVSFWAAVAGLAWSMDAAGCGTSTMMSGVLDFIVVLALVFFRLYLSRLAVKASTATAATRQLRLAGLRDLPAQNSWRAEIGRASQEASELLHGIAGGALDPRAPAVRQRCALMESQLRQLTRWDPGLGELGAVLATALRCAHAAGVRLVVRVGDTDVPTAEGAAALGSIVTSAIGACTGGDTVTIVKFGEPASPQVTITAPVDALERFGGLAAAHEAGWTVVGADVGELCLLELRWERPWTTPRPWTPDPPRVAAEASG